MSVGQRILDWFNSRLGLTATVLRPVPDYSLNPLYWLGALMVMAFVIQTLTGVLMLLYYIPTIEKAYSSTMYITQYVPLGQLLETLHLYTAYAMILLTFLHLLRGYFISVQKKPREMMWVIGMLMGLIVLGFGLTGYLLPWTVVSKSATDVSMGMLSFLPGDLGPLLIFLIAGPGDQAAELTRFFDLHIIVLPAALLTLLAIKMYMFEAHGAAEPPRGVKSAKELGWFPHVLLYFAMIGSVFAAAILVASALFPLQLSPEFTPQAAANYVPQPEWYFLWIYQVLKFASFEGSGIYFALGGMTVLLLVLIALPFIDRLSERDPARRPRYITLGIVGTAELIVLTIWGYLTPGQVISDWEAISVTSGVALVIAAATLLAYRVRARGRAILPSIASPARVMATPFRHKSLTALFLSTLTVGSVSMATAVNLITTHSTDMVLLSGSSIVLLLSFYLMTRIVKVLTLNHSRSASV